MNYEAINFGKKLGLFAEQWQPKLIAELAAAEPWTGVQSNPAEPRR